MSDKEHFDKMLLNELTWKLDREVWAHVQNHSPSEEWSTSKAREETRKLCAEYLGNLDEVKAQLSSKEQELEEIKKEKQDWIDEHQDLAQSFVDRGDELASLRAENERLKDDINVHVAVIENANLNFKDQQEEIKRLKQSYNALDDYFQKTRKRCEDLEAALKENLPEDCVTGQTEVKFCHIRQGDGWKCKHCAIGNF